MFIFVVKNGWKKLKKDSSRVNILLKKHMGDESVTKHLRKVNHSTTPRPREMVQKDWFESKD